MSFPECIDHNASNIFRLQEGGFFRNADIGVEGTHSVDEDLSRGLSRGLGRGLSRGLGAFRSVLHAQARSHGEVGETLGAGRQVAIEEIREGDGVGEAVGDVVALAEPVRDGVDVADEASGEGSASQVGGTEHCLTRFDFTAVRVGGAEVGEYEADRFDGLNVHVGVMEGVGIGFDGVGESIDPRGRRHRRRQARRQGRIENGRIGRKSGVEDGGLPVALAVRDDGDSCGLAARTRRRWNAYIGKASIAEGQESSKFRDAFLVGSPHPYEFASIDHGAAAESDDRVAAIFREQGETLLAEFI